MSKPEILVTCPPMLGLIEEFAPDFDAAGLSFTAAKVEQVLTEETLMQILPEFDGWIMGDDPATLDVLTAATKGKLRAAIKWGVGVDNVDFDAFAALKVPIDNTPGVFGGEVADVALTYLLGLARETYRIDREIRLQNAWPKPSGISVSGRTVAIVGYGDIGQETAKRVLACGAKVLAYDPAFTTIETPNVEPAIWPNRLNEADFLVFTCPLNAATKGMFNMDILSHLKPGVRVVNVARGPVIEEAALVHALRSGLVHSAALDVFEIEPLQPNHELRRFEQCIFGSHNGSNSADAVKRVSRLAISKIKAMLVDDK